MRRKSYNLLLDRSLIESIELTHETDSIEAHIERLLMKEQQKPEPPQQNIFGKLLTYTKKSLGFSDDG
jgi:hypothetical protein